MFNCKKNNFLFLYKPDSEDTCHHHRFNGWCVIKCAAALLTTLILRYILKSGAAKKSEGTDGEKHHLADRHKYQPIKMFPDTKLNSYSTSEDVSK